jgi:PhoH-like ATPase
VVRRTFVLDTSVFLSDPAALTRFDEHEVVIPVVVITELEAKRSHPELGYFARSALRVLDDLRLQHGRLDEPLSVGEHGGHVRVELNNTDPEVLPPGFRLGDNDSRILAVAKNLMAEGCDVTLVSKDLPLRVKASAVGITAEEYQAELAAESGWTGMAEVELPSDELDRLYHEEIIDLDDARQFPCNTGLVLLSERGSGLGRVTGSAATAAPAARTNAAEHAAASSPRRASTVMGGLFRVAGAGRATRSPPWDRTL